MCKAKCCCRSVQSNWRFGQNHCNPFWRRVVTISRMTRCDPQSVSISRPLLGLSEASSADLIVVHDVHLLDKRGDFDSHFGRFGLVVLIEHSGGVGSLASGFCHPGATLHRQNHHRVVDPFHHRYPHYLILRQNPLWSKFVAVSLILPGAIGACSYVRLSPRGGGRTHTWFRGNRVRGPCPLACRNCVSFLPRTQVRPVRLHLPHCGKMPSPVGGRGYYPASVEERYLGLTFMV